MPQTTLEYRGIAMRWQPTRVLCLQAHGPLDADEPRDADILELLADGYSVYVELQPGDGTRYGLFLGAGVDGLASITVMRAGAPTDGSVLVEPDRELTAEDCRPLASHNAWSREFFAWWLNGLRARRPAPVQ
jgi:hypothetical protein